MGFSVVIPARYASTRLPGKPLSMIAGKTLIQRVYECALKSDAEDIVIATDDARIREVAESFSATVCMTSSNHATGTDRIADVIRQQDYSDDRIVVNLQGDEPLMPAAVINQVANNLAQHEDASAATVSARIHKVDELFDPHVVKVVSNRDGYAMYFSRASIPWDREHFPDVARLPPFSEHYRHIGLYAYRAGFLKRFVSWPVCQHEKVESLEQLRILWRGEKIHVDVATEVPGPGIDTPEDLDKVRDLFLT